MDDKKTWFDPHTAFLDLTIVRATILIIFIFVAFSAIVIAWNSDLIFCFNGDSFNNAINQFKVPIGICTLSIPMLALLAANHRSEQTKKQMALTQLQINRTDHQINIAQGQNTFSNYFKHLEEFDKRFKAKDIAGGMHVASPQKLHHYLFPESRHGKLAVAPKPVALADEAAKTFILLCEKFNSELHWTTPALKIDRKIQALVEKFKISQGVRSGIQMMADGESFILTGKTLATFLYQNIFILRYIDEILSFDEKYVTPPNLKKLLDFDMSTIPYDQKGETKFIPFDIHEILEKSSEK